MVKQEIQGAVRVVSARQPIDDDVAIELADVLRQSLGDGQPLVVLDLARTPLINSSGLEVLLDVQDEYEERGGCLKLAGAGPLVFDILRATGVDERFEMFPEAKAAVGSFTR